MPQRVSLDAMIPREDFGIDDNQHTTDEHITEFPIAYLFPPPRFANFSASQTSSEKQIIGIPIK